MPRSESLLLRPTLLLAADEFGSRVLARVRDELPHRLGPWDELPFVECLGPTPDLRDQLRIAAARTRDPLVASRLLQAPWLQRAGLVPHLALQEQTQLFVVSGGSPEALQLAADAIARCGVVGGLETTLWLEIAPAALGWLERSYQLQQSGQQAAPFASSHLFAPDEQLPRHLAEWIVGELSEGELGDHRRSARVNLRQNYPRSFRVAHSETLYSSFFSGYSTLSSATLEAAHQPLVRFGARQLAARELQQFTQPAPVSALDEALSQLRSSSLPLIEEKGTGRRDLLLATLDNHLDELTAWHHATLKESSSARDPELAFDGAVQNFSARLETILSRDLPAQARRWARRTLEAVRSRVLEQLDQEDGQLGRALATLQAADQLLDRSHATLLDKVKRHADVVALAHEPEIRLRAQLQRALKRLNWDGRRRTIVGHQLTLSSSFYSGHQNLAGLWLNQLLENACSAAAQACRDLQAELLEFKERLTYLGGQLQRLSSELEAKQVPPVDLSVLPRPAAELVREFWPERSALLRQVMQSLGIGWAELSSGWNSELRREVRQRLVEEGETLHRALPQRYHVLACIWRESSAYQRTERLTAWLQQAQLQLPLRQSPAGFSFVGIPGAVPGSSLQETAEIEGYAEQLQEWLAEQLGPACSFHRTQQPGRLLLYREVGGFPLADIAQLDAGASEPTGSCVPPAAPQLEELEDACEVLLLAKTLDIVHTTAAGLVCYTEAVGHFRRSHVLGSLTDGPTHLLRNQPLRARLLQQLRTRVRGQLASPELNEVAGFAAALSRHRPLPLGLGAEPLHRQLTHQIWTRYEQRIQALPVVQQHGGDALLQAVARLL